MSHAASLVDPALLTTIKGHLEALRRSPDGELLYKLITRGLKKYGGGQERIEEAFVTFLHSLLMRYAQDVEGHPATRVKARIIQQRLKLHLPETEKSQTSAPPRSRPRHLRSLKVTTNAVSEDMKNTSPASQGPLIVPPATPLNEAAAVSGDSEPRVASDSPAGDLKNLQEGLAKDLTQAITSGDEFIDLLESEQKALSAEGVKDFSDFKRLLIHGLDELVKERQALKQKLHTAGEYLKAVEADRIRLHNELHEAREHTLADELTGLPKREIFIHSLEAELGRVKRYGFALALALIDIDGMAALNEQYGRAGGDAILRGFAKEVLARFRNYDLVARYGGDEFAVIFPNTQSHGAMRALEKARKITRETYVNLGSCSVALPSFSSVLTLFAPGETAAELLKRADDALLHAKQAGHDRIIVALPDR